jgi:hypothetical protein
LIPQAVAWAASGSQLETRSLSFIGGLTFQKMYIMMPLPD